MFGMLRTVLALMVIGHHLFHLQPIGVYAVFGFYIISGYLMTLIMHKSYGYSVLGKYRFVLNRFLRLYPLYWLSAGFSILLIFFIGGASVREYHDSIYMPLSITEMIENIFMIFPAWYPIDVNPRLVPQTWALTVEMFFYCLICLGISKTFIRVKIWFILSVMYIIATFVLELPASNRYFPITAASLPFSIGSAIYFYSENKGAIFHKAKLSTIWLFAAMIANCLVGLITSHVKNIGSFKELAFYMNVIISSLLVYNIAIGGRIVAFNRKTDKFIGDLSYPMYLLHWQTGLLVSYVLFDKPFHEFSIRGGINLIVSITVVLVFSYLAVLMVDKPIQEIREKIKAKNAV
jgi:peptidoglycan/LPS O-acetylase OafA/YrhL